MKKLIANHKFTQKIFLSIIIVLLLSFAIPVHSQAGRGGLLIDPVYDLASTLLDVVCGVLQAYLVDGRFDNSGGIQNINIFNFYLANKDFFNEKVDPNSEYYDESYAEFAYSADAPVQKEFNSEDLDNVIFVDTYAIPMLRYTPEKIFAGLIPALDINFINPTDWRTVDSNYSETDTENGQDALDQLEDAFGSIEDTGGTQSVSDQLQEAADSMESPENNRSIAIQLHETIATWYVALRNLTVVGLMLILVYVGIRMVISSAASDKAKYKQMLMDWLIAMCIVFCLHYIMTFTITIVTEISQAIAGATDLNGNNIGVQVKNASGDVETAFSTDLMGLIRFQMQYNDIPRKIMYMLFYMAMIIYTCMFTFYYLKRVLTMAFLTLISPLVALTYPIDKMRDGKAQAFDMWLKEYIFNALVQPFHLIIYSIFLGSAVELAANNPLYAIVALAFITPAEKILRRFFGFDKAGTAGALGAVASIAGGAAVISGFKSLMAPKKGGGGKTNSGIKTKQRLDGNIQDLGRNNLNGLLGNAEEMENSSPRQAEQANQALSSDGTTEDRADTLSAAASTAGMRQTSSGLWVPNSTRSSPSASTSSSSTNAQRLRESSNSSSNGQHGSMGQGATALTRNVSGGETSVRNMAAQLGARENNQSKKAPSKRIRTIGKVAKGIGNVALQTGKVVGKTAIKAAPGAMIGLAAGIAGDDLGDIWKYTLAGAAVSSTIGSSAVSQAGSFIADSYRNGFEDDEDIIARQEKEYVKSKEWDAMYRHEFKGADGSQLSSAELKAKKQQGAFYDSRGIQGEDAIKAVKLEDQIRQDIGQDAENFSAQDYTARIMKIAKPYTADKLRKESEVSSLTNSITKEIMKGGLDQDTAREQAQIAVKYIKQAKGIKE